MSATGYVLWQWGSRARRWFAAAAFDDRRAALLARHEHGGAVFRPREHPECPAPTPVGPADFRERQAYRRGGRT
jgi:hypothetical protein